MTNSTKARPSSSGLTDLRGVMKEPQILTKFIFPVLIYFLRNFVLKRLLCAYKYLYRRPGCRGEKRKERLSVILNSAVTGVFVTIFFIDSAIVITLRSKTGTITLW